MKDQLPELSALLDDELEPRMAPIMVHDASHKQDLRNAWQEYVLIGDHLRGDASSASDMTASVMARVRAEPVVLAPGNLSAAKSQHPLLALAASVAGVAVVGWLALSGSAHSPLAADKLAAVLPAPTFSRIAAAGHYPFQVVTQKGVPSVDLRVSPTEAASCPGIAK